MTGAEEVGKAMSSLAAAVVNVGTGKRANPAMQRPCSSQSTRVQRQRLRLRAAVNCHGVPMLDQLKAFPPPLPPIVPVALRKLARGQT